MQKYSKYIYTANFVITLVTYTTFYQNPKNRRIMYFDREKHFKHKRCESTRIFVNPKNQRLNYKTPVPIGSIRLVFYLHLVDFYGKCGEIYQSHASYGIVERVLGNRVITKTLLIQRKSLMLKDTPPEL